VDGGLEWRMWRRSGRLFRRRAGSHWPSGKVGPSRLLILACPALDTSCIRDASSFASPSHTSSSFFSLIHTLPRLRSLLATFSERLQLLPGLLALDAL
jgi:hypothetical protein